MPYDGPRRTGKGAGARCELSVHTSKSGNTARGWVTHPVGFQNSANEGEQRFYAARTLTAHPELIDA